MSGHSKWSQIKHQKGAADSKKSKIFSKFSKTISLAARKGEDPSMNPDLRTEIEKAKSFNMPSDSIDRAVKKGAGKLEGVQLESIKYEAYGPGGAAIIIDTITDSKNRTVAELKHLLSQHGAKLAEQGSVMWAFELIENKYEAKNKIPLNENDAKKLDTVLEALDNQNDVQEIYYNAE